MPYRPTRCGGQLADQQPPLGPVPGRRDDAAVGEDGLARIPGQRGRHEGQLDDRPQAHLAQLIVDGVDPGEVEGQDSARAGRDDAVVVVQDRVRSHDLRSEVLVRQPQRLGELGRDLACGRVVAGPLPSRSCDRRSEPTIRHTRSSFPRSDDASTSTVTGPAGPGAVRVLAGSDQDHTGYSAPVTAPTR